MRFSRSRSISRQIRLLHEYRKIVSQQLSMNVLGIFDFLQVSNNYPRSRSAGASVIVVKKGNEGSAERAFTTITWPTHSRRIEPMMRLVYARCQGERGADSTSSIPMSRT